MLLVEQANHLPFGDDKYPARGHGSRRGEPNRLAGQRAFTEEVAAAQHPHDRFFAGPGAAVATAIESTIDFQRDGVGKIISLTWQRDGAPLRVARRVEIEKRENVRFFSGGIQLAGTLISPATASRLLAAMLRLRVSDAGNRAAARLNHI